MRNPDWPPTIAPHGLYPTGMLQWEPEELADVFAMHYELRSQWNGPRIYLMVDLTTGATRSYYVADKTGEAPPQGASDKQFHQEELFPGSRDRA